MINEELTEAQKEGLKKLIGKCEMCSRVNDLHVHRVKRGYQKGMYVLRNVMILCGSCHRMVHCNEPGTRKR